MAKPSGQRQDRRGVGGLERLYPIPRTAGLGNIGDDKPWYNHGLLVVFRQADSLISDFAQPALEKLANEVVGFDDDDATLGGHRNSLMRKATRHPVGDAAPGLI